MNRTDINEIETKKATEKINETKRWFFEKIKLTHLARLIKKKGRGFKLMGFPDGSVVKNPPLMQET